MIDELSLISFNDYAGAEEWPSMLDALTGGWRCLFFWQGYM